MEELCKRCGQHEATTKARQHNLCDQCFSVYVQTKVVKRLEAFRVRNATPGKERKLLLPISLGASSCTLLHIISQQLGRQRARTGRVGFNAHLLHVHDAESGGEKPLCDAMTKLQKVHSDLGCSCTGLNTQQRVSVQPEDAVNDTVDTTLRNDTVTDFFKRATSATAYTDLLEIARCRTIAEEAKARGCESILWSHCTTRLAEKVLSETAKGRGFALSSMIQDGSTSFGISSFYPMRDLLKKEISAFSAKHELQGSDLKDEPDSGRLTVSSRSTNIDAMMKQYFAGVEENYPSIVANVVKTTGKLEVPSAGTESDTGCGLCGFSFKSSISRADVDREYPRGRLDLCYSCSQLE